MRATIFPLAALIIGVTGASASAAPPLVDRHLQQAAPQLPTAQVSEHDARTPPSCVGLASGTAHASCGTATGGPVGGLF